jgi:hypothetical protein
MKINNQYFNLIRFSYRVNVIGVLGALAFSSTLYANNTSELLKKTIVDAQSRFSMSTVQPIATHLSGLDAWVDKSEVKWGNKDLSNFEDQKISYELQLKNREQIEAEQALLNLGQEKTSLKISSYLAKQLNYKYNILIDVVEQHKQQQLLQQKHSLARRELDGWKLKINSDDFRADKLQQADLTLDNIWGEMLQNGASNELLRQQGLGKGNSALSLATLSIKQMLSVVSRMIQSEEYQYHNLSIQAAEMGIYAENKKQQRYAAQRKLSLKSFKVEYDNKDEDFGVSVGIKIPITNNSFERLKEKQALRLSFLEAHSTRQNIADQLREKRNKLLQLNIIWNSNQKLLQKVKHRMSRLSSTPNIDLQTALSTQKIKLIQRNNSIEVKSLREYINFLKIAGMLSAKPYRNWLQAGTPLLF